MKLLGVLLMSICISTTSKSQPGEPDFLIRLLGIKEVKEALHTTDSLTVTLLGKKFLSDTTLFIIAKQRIASDSLLKLSVSAGAVRIIQLTLVSKKMNIELLDNSRWYYDNIFIDSLFFNAGDYQIDCKQIRYRNDSDTICRQCYELTDRPTAAFGNLSSNLSELIPYKLGKKFGYCTKEKQVVIKPKFDFAYPFNGGAEYNFFIKNAVIGYYQSPISVSTKHPYQPLYSLPAHYTNYPLSFYIICTFLQQYS